MGGEYFFDFLKDVLPVLSGLLGVLGVLNVFKTSNNRLRYWGWVAIFIIIISTVATLLLAKKDKQESEEEKRQLQGKIENIQQGIAKARVPIGDVSLTYWSVLPNSNAKVRAYRDYLKEKIEHKVEDDLFHNPPVVNKDLNGTVLDTSGNVAIYDIDKKSKFWPSGRFKEIGVLASTFSVTLCVNSSHMDPKKIRFIMGGGGNGLDWCALAILPGDSSIFYDVKNERIGLMTTIDYDKNFVYSNGIVTSIRDFYNADVVFAFPSSNSTTAIDYLKSRGAPQSFLDSQRTRSEIISEMETESLLLDMGNGQRFNISGEHLKKFITEDGTPFMFIKTPMTEKAMADLSH